MNWPLPARQILIMQLGTVRGIRQRNKSKARRGSLLPNIPVLTTEKPLPEVILWAGFEGAFSITYSCWIVKIILVCVLKGKIFALMPYTVVVL